MATTILKISGSTSDWFANGNDVLATFAANMTTAALAGVQTIANADSAAGLFQGDGWRGQIAGYCIGRVVPEGGSLPADFQWANVTHVNVRARVRINNRLDDNHELGFFFANVTGTWGTPTFEVGHTNYSGTVIVPANAFTGAAPAFQLYQSGNVAVSIPSAPTNPAFFIDTVTNSASMANDGTTVEWDAIDVVLTYTPAAPVTQVGQNVQVRWDALQAIPSDLDLQWDALHSVPSDLDTRWDVITPVSADLDTRWNVSEVQYVSAVGVTDPANGASAALPAMATSAGNAVIVLVSNYTTAPPNVTSVTDTAGNTYTRQGNVQGFNANSAMECWAAFNVTGHASNVVTLNFSGSAQFIRASAVQYEGLDANSFDAQSASTESTPTDPATTAAVTTSTSGCLLLGHFISFGGTSSINTVSNGQIALYYDSTSACKQATVQRLVGAANAYTTELDVTGGTQNYATVSYAFRPAGSTSPVSADLDTRWDSLTQVSNDLTAPWFISAAADEPSLTDSSSGTAELGTAHTALSVTPAGTNRFGIVKIAHFSSANITQVLWGATDITANLIKAAVHDGASRKRMAWFYIMDPPAAPATVTWTTDAVADAHYIIECWQNVDQVTPYSGLTFTPDDVDSGLHPLTLTATAVAGKVINAAGFNWTNNAGANTAWTFGIEQAQIEAFFCNTGGGTDTGFLASSWAYSDGSVTFLWDTDVGDSTRSCAYAITLNSSAALQTVQSDLTASWAVILGFVQSYNLKDGVTAATIASAPMAVTAGNTLIVGTNCAFTDGPVTGVTDTAGNTYSKCGPTDSGGAGHSAEMWVATDIIGHAANVVTVTFDYGVSNRGINVVEYVGLAKTNVYDAAAPGGQTNSGQGSLDHITAATALTDTPNELILGSFVTWNAQDTFAGADGCVVLDGPGPQNVYMVERVVSAVGTYTINATGGSTSQVMAYCVRSFRAAPAAGLASVGANTDLRWDAIAAVSADSTAQWDVLNPVGQPVDLRWDAIASVGQPVDLRWDAVAAVPADLDLRWDAVATVGAQLDARWDALTTAGQPVDLQWDLQSSLSQVGASTDLRWSLSGSAGQSSVLQWGINTATAVDLLVDFTDPPGPIVGTQTFEVLVRRDSQNAGSGVPTVDVELWEAGAFVALLVNDEPITSDTNQLISVQWDASTVTAGADVQCRVVGTVGGTGMDARTVEVGAVSWDALYDPSGGVVNRSLNSRWNVLNVTGSVSEQQWNILNPVGAVSDLRWSLVAAVGRQADLRWDALNATGQNVEARWGLNTSAAADVEARWDLLQIIGQATSLEWDIEAAVGRVARSANLRWDLLHSVASDESLTWTVLNLAYRDSEFRYNVLQAVAADANLRWALLERVFADDEVLWDVTNLAGQNADVRWSLLQALQRSLTGRWDILNPAGADASLRWDMLAQVLADVELRNDLLAAVAGDATLAWQLVALTGRSVELDWSIAVTLYAVSRQTALRWDLQQRILQDLGVPWSILTEAGRDLDAQWSTLQSVGAQPDLRWTILNEVGLQLASRWDLLGQAGVDLTLQWSGLELTARGVNLRWMLNGATGDPLVIMLVQGIDRTLQVAQGPRGFVVRGEDRTVLVEGVPREMSVQGDALTIFVKSG